ncbi:MAG TPA: ABC transporter ATP-binding protein [Acidimicrobiia bacterium]
MSAEQFKDAPLDGPLLELRDVTTAFKTGRGLVHAVDGVSFSLERGKTLGVVGESGCGKSVLSKSVMGLLPKRNVERGGSIRFEGEEIGDAKSSDLRHLWGTQMSMIFQDPMTALNPVMKVGKQITESLRYHLDVSKDFANDTALQLLTSVGIPEPQRRVNQYAFEMSGGMRQRVMIAIALACGPKLLFADEPTTALDVTVQAQILDLLQEQQRERFMAMILVTHDLGVVANRTDDIMVMYAGQAIEKAPTRTLFAEMRHPYTHALLQSIPKLDQPSHSRLDAISGRPPDLVHPPKGCRFAPRCPNAQDRCREEVPPLAERETPGHEFACFYPVGTPEGDEARARNEAEGKVPGASALSTAAAAAASSAPAPPTAAAPKSEA